MKPLVPDDPSKHPITLEWEDAFSSYGWKDLESAREDVTPILVRSRGYLVRETETHIVIAQSICANGTCADLLTVPKPWVKRVVRR